MKLTRRERKIYNNGRQEGYLEGYEKGLYDGNPFNTIIDVIKDFTGRVIDLMNDQELAKAIEEANQINNDIEFKLTTCEHCKNMFLIDFDICPICGEDTVTEVNLPDLFLKE